jgi:hypothetical protein
MTGRLLSAVGLGVLLVSACDPTDVLTHDTTPPTIAVTGISPGETIFENRVMTVVVSDVDSDLDFVEVFADGTEVHEDRPNRKSASYQFNLIVSRETAGQHHIDIRVTDKANNQREYGFNYLVFSP